MVKFTIFFMLSACGGQTYRKESSGEFRPIVPAVRAQPKLPTLQNTPAVIRGYKPSLSLTMDSDEFSKIVFSEIGSTPRIVNSSLDRVTVFTGEALEIDPESGALTWTVAPETLLAAGSLRIGGNLLQAYSDTNELVATIKLTIVDLPWGVASISTLGGHIRGHLSSISVSD
jgi:hypothetical protein